jgi:hypothetical protein
MDSVIQEINTFLGKLGIIIDLAEIVTDYIPPRFFSTDTSFSLLFKNKLITAGHKQFGGYSSSVPDDLKITDIIPNGNSYAALLEDKSVFTWGDPLNGGDSSCVQQYLKNVEQVVSTSRAFAAKSGSCIVSWGDTLWGADNSSTDLKRTDFKIYATARYFFVQTSNGQLIGLEEVDRDIPNNLAEIKSVHHAFNNSVAILLTTGEVKTWGKPGEISFLQTDLKDVETIHATRCAFAAKKYDGTVITWGYDNYSNISGVKHLLTDISSIVTTDTNFAALRGDGKIVCWGSEPLQNKHKALRSVKSIHATSGAFCAILPRQSIDTWGDSRKGANKQIQSTMQNRIIDIIGSNRHIFAALTRQGIEVFGLSKFGGGFFIPFNSF